MFLWWEIFKFGIIDGFFVLFFIMGIEGEGGIFFFFVEFVVIFFMFLKDVFLFLLLFDKIVDIIFKFEFLKFMFLWLLVLEVKLGNIDVLILVGKVVRSGNFVLDGKEFVLLVGVLGVLVGIYWERVCWFVIKLFGFVMSFEVEEMGLLGEIDLVFCFNFGILDWRNCGVVEGEVVDFVVFSIFILDECRWGVVG